MGRFCVARYSGSRAGSGIAARGVQVPRFGSKTSTLATGFGLAAKPVRPPNMKILPSYTQLAWKLREAFIAVAGASRVPKRDGSLERHALRSRQAPTHRAGSHARIRGVHDDGRAWGLHGAIWMYLVHPFAMKVAYIKLGHRSRYLDMRGTPVSRRSSSP